MSKSVRSQFRIIPLLVAALAIVLGVLAAQPALARPDAQDGGCVSPPSGLVSWWPGNGDATDVAGDNDGLLQNGATFGDGMVEQAFSLSGSNQRILIADSPSLALTESFTVDAWVRLTSYPGGASEIVFRGDDRPLFDPYTLRVVGTNARMQIESAEGVIDFVEAPIGIGEFVHVAGTLDDATGELTLYLDGSVADQKTTTIRPAGALTGANPGVSIGNLQSDFVLEPFVGEIDEVEIFDRALTGSEIESIVDAGSGGKCNGEATLVPEIVSAVPDPSEVSTDPRVIATNASLALLAVIVVLLSAQVFNSAVGENEQEIERFGRSYVRPLLSPYRAARAAWRRVFAGNPRIAKIIGIGAILAMTALIYGYLEPEFSLDEKGILLVISMAIGLGVVTYVHNGTKSRFIERRLGIPAGVRVYPAALVIAVVCVLITRALSFQPGVLYGFVAAGAVFGSRKPESKEEGQALVVAATALIGTFIIAWFLMVPFREWTDSDDNWISVTLESSSTLVVVAALETLAFSMFPLKFQDGLKVWSYSWLAWFILAVLAVFFCWQVVLAQDDAGFKVLGEEGTIVMLAALVVCVGITASTWGFFYFRHRSAAGESPPDRPLQGAAPSSPDDTPP